MVLDFVDENGNDVSTDEDRMFVDLNGYSYKDRTGIHTVIADDAISCVALGTGKSLDSLNAMQDGTMNLSRRKQMN